jgi:hypothetical protein
MRGRRRTSRRWAPGADLTICRSCGAECVIPIEWMQQPDSSWWMYLRCGSCGASREVVVRDSVAQRYDADLDRGTHEIAAALRRLEREQMAEQADALATALRLNLLDATDLGG